MHALKWIGLLAGFPGAVLALLVFFGLGLHRKPNFIRNFEVAEYGPFLEPHSVENGLAAYAVGRGEPVLLFPYPHAHTTAPMAAEPLAQLLVNLDRRVVTFDVPGAYRSTREPVGDMDEMIRSADETLARLGIEGPVDVVGHSMGALSALAYAVERPERVKRLVLVGGVSGFPAAARQGLPGSAFSPWDPDYWRVIFWGMQVANGRGNLALHKRLQNLMGRACFHDKSHFTPLEVETDDQDQGVPVRMIWTRNMYRRLSYADKLALVQASTLVLTGRHDPETPLANAQELHSGIPDSRLVVFNKSGHSPFIEETAAFQRVVGAFLNYQL